MTTDPVATQPSKSERAWRDALALITSHHEDDDLFTAREIYDVMADWADDLDRRGEASKHELRRLAAERLGV